MKNQKFSINLCNKLTKSILTSIRYLENQSKNDYCEADHLLKFPWWAGFRYYNAPHVGNVFQSSIIANTLLTVKKNGYLIKECLIESLIQKILNQKQKSCFGWKYFPHLKELPPDIDDLAQIIQLFINYDRQLVDNHCLEVVNFVLKNCINNNGSINTWIYNSKSKNSIHKLYSNNIRKKWGSESDPEVIANFIYSLYLIDNIYYKDIIAKGIIYLKSKMHDSYYWSSNWYWGKSYGTYICTRILSLYNENKLLNAIKESIILKKRNKFGFINPLEEAFNLLTLLTINKKNPIPVNEFEQYFNYLITTQNNHGYWDAIPFIKMNRKRTKGGESYLSYQSSIITTCYCLYAIITYQATINEYYNITVHNNKYRSLG